MAADSGISFDDSVMIENLRDELLGPARDALQAGYLSEREFAELEAGVARRLALLASEERTQRLPADWETFYGLEARTFPADCLHLLARASVDPLLASLFTFVGGLAMGVAGNFAHEGVKALIKRFRDRNLLRARPPPLTARELELLNLVALYVTVERLNDQFSPCDIEHIPKLTELVVGGWQLSKDRGFWCQEAEVRARSDPSFTAFISVPERRTGARPVNVLIVASA